jgi:hypothetical protein
MACPVAVRAAAVQVQHDRHLLVRAEVARIIEEVGAPGFHFDDRPGIDDAIARAILVRTVQRRRRDAARTAELEWFVLRGSDAAEPRDNGDHAEKHPVHRPSIRTRRRRLTRLGDSSSASAERSVADAISRRGGAP